MSDQIITLALDAVKLLLSHLTRSGEVSSQESGKKIYDLLKRKSKGKPVFEKALLDLKNSPTEKDFQSGLRIQLERSLEGDKPLQEELVRIIEMAKKKRNLKDFMNLRGIGVVMVVIILLIFIAYGRVKSISIIDIVKVEFNNAFGIPTLTPTSVPTLTPTSVLPISTPTSVSPASTPTTVSPASTPTSVPPTSTPTSTPIRMKATFNSPKDGDHILQQVNDVIGKYENIPTDKILWLYVYTTGSKKYYLNKIDLLANGDWKVDGVYIGEPKGPGKFKLGVIAISQQDSNSLEQDAKSQSDQDSLPANTEKLVEITIYRK